ncbi:hypothetical protein SAMN05660662_1784 [Blastococcus aurantiacus]|uniref:Uncharacterized protein n=2 Tax=Blastococcus aurantiacus TaxID=1550231 RepID=A0A1G7JYV1_9ACTN|nr:hypothetical protein SAMN05660662_1784 [Blastococcus aurantiacus]
MRRAGLEPLATLASFPIIGSQQHNTRSYADVAYEWWGVAPSPDSTVRLTICGVAHQPHVPQCNVRVNLFLALLRTAAEVERDTDIDPVTVTPIALTSADLAKRIRTPLDRVNDLYDVVSDEPLQGVGGRGRAPDGSWRIDLDPGIRVYQEIRTVDDYLTSVRADLTPAPMPPPPRVLPSPVSLATALGYLDVTWQLHAGKRLQQEVTDLAGATALAFDVGNEDEFRSRCSALMDLTKNWNVPGLSGAGGGHPVERLAAYLDTKLAEDEVADARTALDVLDAVRRIRSGQQHAHKFHEAVEALNGLGISGPPFDWSTAWSTLRERVTVAVLDLRDAVSRLPR